MSIYPPPREILPVFNPYDFQNTFTSISLADADARYLKLSGGILGGTLSLPDASVANPALNFANDIDMGFYRVGTDNFGIAVNGVKQIDVNASRVEITNPVLLPAGSVTNPALSFIGDPNTGLYNTAADQLGITLGGVLTANFTASDAIFLSGFSADSVSADQINLNNSTVTFTGATGSNIIAMPDNLADSFSIQESTNKYMTFTTTNTLESVALLKDTSITGNLSSTTGDIGTWSLDANNEMSNTAQPYVTYTDSAAQTITDATITKVVFDTTLLSNGVNYATYATGNFTINSTGFYILTYSLTYNASTVGDRQIFWANDSATTTYRFYKLGINNAGTNGVRMSGSCVFQASSSDVFSLFTVQSSGGNLDILATDLSTRKTLTLAKLF